MTRRIYLDFRSIRWEDLSQGSQRKIIICNKLCSVWLQDMTDAKQDGASVHEGQHTWRYSVPTGSNISDLKQWKDVLLQMLK